MVPTYMVKRYSDISVRVLLDEVTTKGSVDLAQQCGDGRGEGEKEEGIG